MISYDILSMNSTKFFIILNYTWFYNHKNSNLMKHKVAHLDIRFFDKVVHHEKIATLMFYSIGGCLLRKLNYLKFVTRMKCFPRNNML